MGWVRHGLAPPTLLYENRKPDYTKTEKEHQIDIILTRNLTDNKSKIESIDAALIQIQRDIDPFDRKI